jgi:hypothetical protein
MTDCSKTKIVLEHVCGVLDMNFQDNVSDGAVLPIKCIALSVKCP